MITLICLYLLIGTVSSFLIEVAMQWATNNEMSFTMAERSVSIIIWPITTLVFVYHFIKGMFN